MKYSWIWVYDGPDRFIETGPRYAGISLYNKTLRPISPLFMKALVIETEKAEEKKTKMKQLVVIFLLTALLTTACGLGKNYYVGLHGSWYVSRYW